MFLNFSQRRLNFLFEVIEFSPREIVFHPQPVREIRFSVGGNLGGEKIILFGFFFKLDFLRQKSSSGNFPWRNKHFPISYLKKLPLPFPTLLITKLETESKYQFSKFHFCRLASKFLANKANLCAAFKKKYKQLKHH